ncbi:putative membrane protein [Helicobacter pylori Hp P-13]|nr:putative membrane protein [Helicobacter pylori Hp P-13]
MLFWHFESMSFLIFVFMVVILAFSLHEVDHAIFHGSRARI